MQILQFFLSNFRNKESEFIGINLDKIIEVRSKFHEIEQTVKGWSYNMIMFLEMFKEI